MTARQLAPADIAALLGVKPSTIRAYLARGQMPAPTGRLGRTPWWSSEDIEAWMTGYKKGAASRERERAAKLVRA